MSSLTELREKVERASGQDRQLDRDICAALFVLPISWNKPTGLPDWTPFGEWSITGSIDAAFALVKEKLPETFLELAGPFRYLHIPTPKPNYWCAELGIPSCRGWGATAPLAILACLFRALESQEQAGG